MIVERKGLLLTDLIAVEDGPSEESPQDVSLLLGGGLDVLVDAECEGTGMVADPADSDAVRLVANRSVGGADGGRGGLDDRTEYVDIEI